MLYGYNQGGSIMSVENKSFSYKYSGATNDELKQIKEKYSQKESNHKIKKIRALDKRVDFISAMISIFTGIIGTAFLITGTIHIIKELSSFAVGAAIVMTGIAIISTVPYIHIKIYNFIKLKYAPKILALIEEIEQRKI